MTTPTRPLSEIARELRDGLDKDGGRVQFGPFSRKTLDGAAAALIRAEERVKAADRLAEALARDAYGCRFCDSGKLRKPNDPHKDHDDDCAWVALAAYRDSKEGS